MGYSIESLLRLKDNGFVVDDKQEQYRLALGLLPCLASLDTRLRDEISFDALLKWMRDKQLDSNTLSEIYSSLLPWLADDYPDPDGVARPFAALVLSEVARVDRIEPFLESSQRQTLLVAGAAFLHSVRDYRGYDEVEGWRHGVAHGADLILQLALNPTIDNQGLQIIALALRPQIVPANSHFYIYGEAQRLARAMYYVALRQLDSDQWWQQWLVQLISPAPFDSWSDIYRTQQGLAKRHNTRSFLRAMITLVSTSGNEAAQKILLASLTDASRTVP